MKKYNQLDDEFKKILEQNYNEAEGGSEAFYNAYRDSKSGRGEYADIYDAYEAERKKASGDLLIKYGGTDNGDGGGRVPYKDFDEETLANWKADQAAYKDKYGNSDSYRNYLYGKVRKAGDIFEPPEPGPIDRPVKPGRPERPTRPVRPPARDGEISDSFNQSFNSGNGSGNVVKGDRNILGKGNMVIGDIFNKIGNKGDTSINLRDSTIGNNSEIGVDRSENMVDMSFRPQRPERGVREVSPAVDNLNEAIRLLDSAKSITRSGNRSGNSGAGSGNLVKGDENILGDYNFKVGDIKNVVGNSGDTNVNISGSTLGSGVSIGNDYTKNIINGRFGIALDDEIQEEANRGAFRGRDESNGLYLT